MEAVSASLLEDGEEGSEEPECLAASAGPQPQRHEQVKANHFQEEDA